MHPENVLLPLTYGAASILTIGCLSLCAIALFGATFAIAGARARTGRFRLRPGSAWVLLAGWSGMTGWVASGYRDSYHAAASAQAAQQIVPSEAEANTTIIMATSPSVWAVKTILLVLVGGFLWVGTSRARATAALLLAHSHSLAEPARQVARKNASAAVHPAAL